MRMKTGLIGLLLLLFHPAIYESVEQPDSLDVEAEYYLLTGPLIGHYRLASPLVEARVFLQRYSDNVTIAVLPINGSVLSGSVAFPCGQIAHPGRYHLLLTSSTHSTPTVQSQPCNAVWPRVTMTMPLHHFTQTPPDVRVRSKVRPQFVCDPARVADSGGGAVVIPTALQQAVYLYEVISSSSAVEEGTVRQEAVRYSESARLVHVIPFSLAGWSAGQFSLTCGVFERAGRYEVRLESTSTRSSVSIAVSNHMTVTWSPVYSISTLQPSLWPCQTSLTVNYARPGCVSRADKIQLFARWPRSLAQRDTYLFEQLADVDKTSVSFSCNAILQYHYEKRLDGSVPNAYCLQYNIVSNTESVAVHSRLCFPFNSTQPIDVDGEWGPWGACQPAASRPRRTRYCNSPQPRGNGRHCEGNSVSDCQLPQAPTPAKPTEGGVLPPPTGECDCGGCTLKAPIRTQGSFSILHRCPHPVGSHPHLTWIIEAPSWRVLSIALVQVSLAPGEIVRVRDGVSQRSRLLLVANGDGQEVEEKNVTSLGSRVQVEYVMSRGSGLVAPSVVISYQAIRSQVFRASPAPPSASGTDDEGDSNPWWVALIAIVVVAGVVGAAALVFYRRRKAAEQNKEGKEEVDTTFTPTDGTSSPDPLHSKVDKGSYHRFAPLPGPSIGADQLYSEERRTSRAHRHRRHHRHRESSSGSSGRRTRTPDDVTGSGVYVRGSGGDVTGSGAVPEGSAIPHPYGVKPEDFLHEVDILRAPPPARREKRTRRKSHGKSSSKPRKRRQTSSDQRPCLDETIESLTGATVADDDGGGSGDGERKKHSDPSEAAKQTNYTDSNNQKHNNNNNNGVSNRSKSGESRRKMSDNKDVVKNGDIGIPTAEASKIDAPANGVVRRVEHPKWTPEGDSEYKALITELQSPSTTGTVSSPELIGVNSPVLRNGMVSTPLSINVNTPVGLERGHVSNDSGNGESVDAVPIVPASKQASRASTGGVLKNGGTNNVKVSAGKDTEGSNHKKSSAVKKKLPPGEFSLNSSISPVNQCLPLQERADVCRPLNCHDENKSAAKSPTKGPSVNGSSPKKGENTLSPGAIVRSPFAERVHFSFPSSSAQPSVSGSSAESAATGLSATVEKGPELPPPPLKFQNVPGSSLKYQNHPELSQRLWDIPESPPPALPPREQVTLPVSAGQPAGVSTDRCVRKFSGYLKSEPVSFRK